MRALVISPQPFFTPRGTPFSVYYRAAVAAELGVEMDLLTYGEGQDVDLPGLRILRTPRLRFLGSVPVGPSYHKLVLDLFLVLRTVGLLLRNRYDFVHAHEEAVFFCRFLKPVFRFKLVYDMHSSLPQQLSNFAFTSSRILIGLFRRLEAGALEASDAVVTVCPDLAAYVKRFGIDERKHILIENSIFDPVRIADAVPQEVSDPSVPLPGLPEGAPRVVYAGTLEPYQGIDLLIAAFARLRSRFPDASLLVLGGTAGQVERYRGLAKSLGVEDRCHFTGRVSQETAQRCCAGATVQVSPRTSGTNTPLKVYQQLASGVAIVATRIHSHTQVLDESVAFFAEPEADALADALTLALRDPELRERKSAAAKRLYEERYSRRTYAGKMVELLRRLS